jgi:23S rRNA (cytidine1920-2'-O)/16S rRNA (cytidine1409-2'-O)-methyltransferase
VTRRRLDAELVRRGLVSTRTEAREAVSSGLVTVGGVIALKPATLVEDGVAVNVTRPARRFVSRGGEKLAAALDRFSIDVRDRRCLDAGASTGGFTDCLLQAGASSVVAADVGYGQLAWTLRTDPRVVVRERVNVRNLRPTDLPFAPEIVVADLSFISLRLVLAPLASTASDRAAFILLVKPQFEAGAAEVAKGGVVRDDGVWRRTVIGVVDAARTVGLAPQGVMASPLLGQAGNVEFLLHCARGPAERTLDLDAAVRAGRELQG